MDIHDKKESLIKHLIASGYLKTPRIIEAFRKVPREKFVTDEYKNHAYVDEPLPIGGGQTISAPHMVAIMTEFLEPSKTDRVLEIGTGSGYQAAILSLLVAKVFTIELDSGLVSTAKSRLKSMGYSNVEVFHGDGSKGLPDKAPFDKIIVTCGSDKIYPAWAEQLKEGGLIIAPIGNTHHQTLTKSVKANGKLSTQHLMSVAFVPLRHN